MGMEGKVLLKVFVSREGGVLNIEISQSSGYEILDNAALEAVKNWRFVPARQGETPRDEWVQVQVPVAFVLRR
jgi:protein TonB